MSIYTKLCFVRSLLSPVLRVSTKLKRHLSNGNSVSGFVNINDDEQLYYEQCGNESDETILCMPGALGSTRSDFNYQLDYLSNTFNVVAYDPRGYGKSQITQRKFDLNYFHQDASDAAEVMKKLGHTQYSILGWSDGGIAGMILAAQERSVKNLIIWGSCAYVTREDVQLIERTRDLNKWSEKMRTPLELVYGQEGLKRIWGDFCDGYIAFCDKPGGICISELKDICCPTLIIHGAKDPLVPSFHPPFLHENIRNSKLIVLPNGKHNLHMRYHEEFNTMIHQFIKQC